MPKFRVVYEETALYETVVEALTAEEAESRVVQPSLDGYEHIAVRTLVAVVERTAGCTLNPDFETKKVTG